MNEELALLAVQGGGEYLVMQDKRRFRVNPRELNKSMEWRPTAKVQILEETGDGANYPVPILNLENGEGVMTRLEGSASPLT